MNENLDLTKILEGCPEGTIFYSTVYGEVSFERINTYDEYPILLLAYNKYARSLEKLYYSKEGNLTIAYKGECTLFPSKDQRDWSKFERFWDKPKVEKFDPKTLPPFDKVLVRDRQTQDWGIEFFGFMTNTNPNLAACLCNTYEMVIPYNEETKHLLGKTDDCPEYYKWWEE